MFSDFYKAWNFLDEHPMFENHKYDTPTEKFHVNMFQQSLDISVVKINPIKDEIDDDISLNTKTQVWLETGPHEYDEYANDYVPTHDINLDCGGYTFEEAIVNLANLVKQYYNDDGTEK